MAYTTVYCIVYPAGEWLTHQKSIIAHIYSDNTFFEVSKKYPYMRLRKRACFFVLLYTSLIYFLPRIYCTIHCTLLLFTLNCEHLELRVEIFSHTEVTLKVNKFFSFHYYVKISCIENKKNKWQQSCFQKCIVHFATGLYLFYCTYTFIRCTYVTQAAYAEMEILNSIFLGFLGIYWVFSDSSFCLVFYPHFSLLQNAVHEKNRVFLFRGFFKPEKVFFKNQQ